MRDLLQQTWVSWLQEMRRCLQSEGRVNYYLVAELWELKLYDLWANS